MDGPERKCHADVARYGCHILHVLGEEESPPFSYSVGIEKTSRAPEVVVIGLGREVSHFMINEYNRRVREGEPIECGSYYEGFIDLYPVFASDVDPTHYETYFGWNFWFYDGPDFRVIQLVYPTKENVWPWDEGAPETFVRWQPVLSTPS